MKTKIPLLVVLLTLFLAAAGAALTNGVPARPRWVLGSGASASTAGDVTMRATLGQPVVGGVSGGDVVLGQGFWYGGTSEYSVYLPLVIRNY